MKARARLLEFLRDGPAVRDVLQGAPAGAGDMLVRRDGARLLTNALAAAISDGLVRETEMFAATPEATAWLARHAARALDAPFERQHQRREAVRLAEPDGERVAVIDRNHSPLSRLAAHKGRDGTPWLDPEGVEAGERFARDFEIGGLRQRVTSSWDPTPCVGRAGAGGQADLGDAAIDARGRLERALAHLGPDLAGVALDICCFAKGTSQVERERRWPPRSAKLMLRAALDLLARHYGVRAGAGAKPPRQHVWHAQPSS